MCPCHLSGIMPYMQREIVVSLEDIQYVCIECPLCTTRVTLDMKERSAHAKARDVFAPTQCPACRNAYDSAIRDNVDHMQRVYELLLKVSKQITFRGKPEGGSKDNELLGGASK